jgi:hypothetical protein
LIDFALAMQCLHLQCRQKTPLSVTATVFTIALKSQPSFEIFLLFQLLNQKLDRFKKTNPLFIYYSLIFNKQI